MAKLKYTKIRSGGTGRYDLMIDAKVKELIDYYEISSLLIFQREIKQFIESYPKTNAFHFCNAYRVKIEKGILQIWRQFSGSNKDPILIYEIREEVSHD